jgi:hypothetical protein
MLNPVASGSAFVAVIVPENVEAPVWENEPIFVNEPDFNKEPVCSILPSTVNTGSLGLPVDPVNEVDPVASEDPVQHGALKAKDAVNTDIELVCEFVTNEPVCEFTTNELVDEFVKNELVWEFVTNELV